MKILLTFLLLIIVVIGALSVWTWLQARQIEADYPPVGHFFGEAGARLHYVDIRPDTGADLPALVFVHGASGNLNDQMGAFVKKLNGRARMIFVDRPGHGYSDRAGAENPAKQAEQYRKLLDDLDVEKAVFVGHSLGAASVAAFAVLYPEYTKGLVFLAPATHPWSTGVTWYYDIAAMPVVGHLFTHTLTLPVGMRSLESGSKHVFEPQELPKNYIKDAAIALMLRPETFRNNARDVAGLNEFVSEFSPRYQEIKVPTVVITGDVDDVVAPSIHSIGLERDIEGAELIVVPGLGHKPDYTATDQVIAAIEKVSK